MSILEKSRGLLYQGYFYIKTNLIKTNLIKTIFDFFLVTSLQESRVESIRLLCSILIVES